MRAICTERRRCRISTALRGIPNFPHVLAPIVSECRCKFATPPSRAHEDSVAMLGIARAIAREEALPPFDRLVASRDDRLLEPTSGFEPLTC